MTSFITYAIDSSTTYSDIAQIAATCDAFKDLRVYVSHCHECPTHLHSLTNDKLQKLIRDCFEDIKFFEEQKEHFKKAYAQGIINKNTKEYFLEPLNQEIIQDQRIIDRARKHLYKRNAIPICIPAKVWMRRD